MVNEKSPSVVVLGDGSKVSWGAWIGGRGLVVLSEAQIHVLKLLLADFIKKSELALKKCPRAKRKSVSLTYKTLLAIEKKLEEAE